MQAGPARKVQCLMWGSAAAGKHFRQEIAAKTSGRRRWSCVALQNSLFQGPWRPQPGGQGSPVVELPGASASASPPELVSCSPPPLPWPCFQSGTAGCWCLRELLWRRHLSSLPEGFFAPPQASKAPPAPEELAGQPLSAPPRRLMHSPLQHMPARVLLEGP